MKIAVVTLGTDNIESYTKFSFDLNERYCKKHGYDFIRYSEVLDENRPVSWSKLLALKNHLNDYDWLFWIDADAIFHNPLIRIEERIDEQYNFICGKSFGEGWTPYSTNPDIINMNAGVFLLKGKSPWSIRFINNLYGRTERIDHMWWENQALMDLMFEKNEYFSDKIKVIDQFLLNGYLESLYAYYGYCAEQYILHLAGLPTFDRVEVFGELHQELIQKHYSG